MARSKKRKRLKQPSQAFYESLPISVTSPAILPDLGHNLHEGASELKAAWLQLTERARDFSWHDAWFRFLLVMPGKIRLVKGAVVKTGRTGARILRTVLTRYVPRLGLEVSNRLIATGRSLGLGTRIAAGTAREYLPSVADDARRHLRRVARVAISRHARVTYLALGAIGLVSAAGLGLTIATATLHSYANDISSPAALLAKKKTGTTILDRNGNILFEGYGGQADSPVALGELPASMRDATLAAEDPDFYNHPGFSWQGTARAAWVDITHGQRAEGGSTLTQQLVKNALLTSNKNFQRKYQELLLSIELEKRYSKDQILEMYLNEVYYGQGASGVEPASQTYFHKPAHDLSLGESALLAGLPLGPSRFDPNIDPDAATGRRDYVLGRMAELGKITKAQAAAAKAQPIHLASAGDAPAGSSPMTVYTRKLNIRAPHFVFYVLDQLRRQYGDDVVEEGGITVHTTLDLPKQELAQQIVTDRVSALAEHHVTNGGLVSIEPGSGDILAMVGSVGYNTPGFGNVNVTLSELQPGSSFKPIAYATAFKKGWTGATHVDDTPLSVPNGDGTMYTPMNYDLKFHGSVSLRHALDNSLNIPAVKVLQFAGIHDTIATAHDMGITTLQDESRFGLALVLGGGEVRPIDMATVYATFANNGTRVAPRAIMKVTDRHGKDITKANTSKPQAALDPRVAYMISSILSDDTSRQPEFPANGPLHLSRPAAAKTGTTNDFRDNWTVGYTPNLATAVWVGNNDHTAMNNVDGITGAAPIWHDYMEGALATMPTVAFKAPPGVSTAKVCDSDGNLANAWDSGRDEVFMSDAMPTKQCSSAPKIIDIDFFKKIHDGDNPNDPTKPQDPGTTPPIIRFPKITPPPFFD